MVLQRLCRAAGNVHLKHEHFQQDFLLLEENEEGLILGISDVVRGQWGLKSGMHVQMTLEDRGRPYEAILEMAGHGRLEGVESCRFEHPRVLKCLQDDRLSDYVPDRPLPCTYTTHTLDIRDGRIRAFGLEGVELSYSAADAALKGGLLRLGGETVLGLVLGKDERLVAPSRVAHFGNGFAGLRFREDGDRAFLLPYRQWLEERVRGQRQGDQEGFTPKGAKAAPGTAEAEGSRTGSEVKILVDHDPMLLVISEGDAFPKRVAEALGRKYGVACLDYVKGEVHGTLAPIGGQAEGWGRARLMLVHQRLRVSSGLELTRQLVQEEQCPLPILVVGIEEDVSLKRNRAIAAGAVDFISVEPFNVLRVMKAIEETLKMFA